MANILVCDDERSMCEMLDIALRRDGHKVETANSGEVAKRKIGGALYDLIITDIKMPFMDGFELMEQLKVDFQLQSIPVVVMTGWLKSTDEP